MHKILCMPSKSLFLQSCVSSGGSIVGLMVTSSKRAYAITQVCCTQSPWSCGRPLLTHTSAGDKHSKADLAQSLWCTQRFIWAIRVSLAGNGFDSNTILPLLPSCWSFSFALGCGLSFFGGIQHSPVDGCSAASNNFGVLAREDKHTSFYSTIFHLVAVSVQESPAEAWVSSITMNKASGSDGITVELFQDLKDDVKAGYCHCAYLTYMQRTSCEMPGWVKHKLESRLLGEISVTSDMQMTPPLWQKANKN